MVDSINKIELSHSEVILREDGILQIVVKDNVDVGIEECIELTNAFQALIGKKKVPLLHVVGNYVNMDKEAREYSASEAGLRYSIAEAFVINSLPNKIIANFYMRINKPSVPTKFFGSIREAEEWLKNFL